MSKLPERISAVAALLALIVAVIDGLLGQKTGLLVFRALLPYSFWTVALCAVVFARSRLARLAAEEKLDAQLAGSERGDSALFEKEEFESLWIGRSRAQFEQYVVPATAPAFAIALGIWSWQLFRALPLLTTTPSDVLLGASFLGGQAFFLFLFSRYLIGLARDAEHRLLRGPGIGAGVLCAASLFAMVTAFIADAAWLPADRFAAQALAIFLAFVAIENAIRFLMALYSPKRQQAFGGAYESRIGGLIADPATWARSVALTMDYQFGFKVSDTWFYRFMEGALVPLIAIQLVALYLMSCLVFIGPEEEGILEHFGKPVPGQWHLDSGFHFKAPWPFDMVRRLPAKRVLSVHVGYEPDGAEPPRVLLWTVPHFKNEDMFLTASAAEPTVAGAENASVPVNLITVNIPVEYRVTNIFAYVYNFAEPTNVLREVSYRALTRELNHGDLSDLLTASRLDIAGRLKDAIQQEADRLGLGVQVLVVSLQGIHPPVPVADAFQSVVGSMEEREAKILQARAYAAGQLPIAEANAVRVKREAQAYRDRRVKLAEAEAQQFEKRLGAYRTAPEVFKSRQYLGSLRDTLANTRKYIVDAPASEEIIYLNLEDKTLPGLFDMSSPDDEGLTK